MTIGIIKTDIPRVSVLMTIYNAERFLRESIDSLIAQSFPDWELIAVENGSTDTSPSILADYSDSRVRVFPFSENIGRTTALRFAFDQARGEYIAVLDADDVSHLERLARQVAFLDQHPDVVLVGSWSQYIDEASQVYNRWSPPTNGDDLHDCLGWMNPFVHSSVMYRQEAALAVGGYPEECSYAQDFALIISLACHGKLAMIDKYLCQWRVFTGSMTQSNSYRLLVRREQLLTYQMAKDLPLTARARRLNSRAIAISEIQYGLASLCNKSILAGLKMILSGVTRYPPVLWQNSPVRRFFGLRDSQTWRRFLSRDIVLQDKKNDWQLISTMPISKRNPGK